MKQAIINFSGGSDSTLAAAIYAEKFDRVHLLSYDRLSFVGAAKYTRVNYENLVRIYGSDKIRRVVIPIGRWHKIINYHQYLRNAAKHKFAIVSLLFCKLAFHWRAIIFGIENGCTTVADGMVPYMRIYPDQNEKICLKAVRNFYTKFDMVYENPIWECAEDAEQLLYDRGISTTPNIRGTEKDKQVTYAEQFIFALFAKYYTMKHGMDGYEDSLAKLFNEKIDFMEKSVLEWKNSKDQNSLIHKLLAAEKGNLKRGEDGY